MIKKNIFFLFLITTQAVYSQMFDSIRLSLKEEPKLYGTYDARGSFINNQIAQIKSVKIGLTWKKQFTLAIGYNWLNTKFNSTLSNGVSTSLKMRFITPYVEYSFLEKNNIEVTIPVHLGIGESFYQDKFKNQYNNGFVLIYEPAMTLTYRFLKYFGVGGGIGYRILLVGNKKVNEQFNSPTYTIKTKLFFGDIYKDLKDKF